MAEVNDFNTQVIEEFRANHGKVGHGFENSPMVLLTTTGARSGQKRVNPLVPLLQGDRIYVVASKGGAPTHPDWYHNVVAHPDVEVELGDERFPAEAVVVEGPERDRLFAAQVAAAPGFGEYQEKAGARVIPIIELRRKA
jgi:deazaflavin-dependent oxidoreductase (nitroreductase family)